MVSADVFTGTIKVNSFKPEGTYNIKLEGTLPDLISKEYLVFKIIITIKDPFQPYFMAEPEISEMIEIMAGIQIDTFYKLPVDSGCNGCYVTHNPPLPRFI